MKPVVAVIVVALAILPGRQSGERAIPSKTASAANEKSQPANTPAADSTVIAAGDIVDCSHLADSEATAKLLDSIPGTVLAIGDLAYPDGSSANFRCYDKTWGRHKARTRPAPGNHEYHTPGAAGYLKYFGKAVGSPGHAYYSFNLGAWHIIALDSQCKDAGGCEKGSPEEMWLRKDLAKNASNCILAFWHVPLFSSGNEHGNAPQMKPFWDDLYAAGADVVLNGHDHDYERFAAQNPDGVADPERGIREFVVGTGGKSKRGFKDPAPTSEIRDSSTFGVLQMTLRAHDYEWKFIPVAGGQFSDSGSGSCHK
jgi:acid phosphatase type 7